MVGRLGRFAWQQVRERPHVLALVVFLVVLAVPFFHKPHSDWEQTYIPAGQHILAGQDVYSVRSYMYPPLAAWMAVPFGLMPREWGRFAWFAVNAGALIVLLRGAWRLSGGGRLGGSAGVWRERLILGLGLACGLGYVLAVFANQQTDLIVAALMMLGCSLMGRGRGLGSGVAFGLAAGLKCTPLLWAPYLMWRGKWMAAVMVLVVAVSANLLPDLIQPPPGGTPRLAAWADKFLVPMSKPKHVSGTWGSAITFNHSLAGVSQRWLCKAPVYTPGGITWTNRPDAPSPLTLKVILAGVAGAFLVSALVAAGRKPFGWGEGRSDLQAETTGGGLPSREGVEFGLVLILMLLFSPMSSKPHFCTLLLPGLCLARFVVQRRSLLLGGVLLAVVLGGVVIHDNLLGSYLADSAVWYGSVFWQAVLLFVGCCGMLAHLAWGKRNHTAPAAVAQGLVAGRAA